MGLREDFVSGVREYKHTPEKYEKLKEELKLGEDLSEIENQMRDLLERAFPVINFPWIVESDK